MLLSVMHERGRAAAGDARRPLPPPPANARSVPSSRVLIPLPPPLAAPQMLRMLGVDVGEPAHVSFNGLQGLELWPRLVWTPRWAMGFAQLKARSLGGGGRHAQGGRCVRACVRACDTGLLGPQRAGLGADSSLGRPLFCAPAARRSGEPPRILPVAAAQRGLHVAGQRLPALAPTRAGQALGPGGSAIWVGQHAGDLRPRRGAEVTRRRARRGGRLGPGHRPRRRRGRAGLGVEGTGRRCGCQRGGADQVRAWLPPVGQERKQGGPKGRGRGRGRCPRSGALVDVLLEWEATLMRSDAHAASPAPGTWSCCAGGSRSSDTPPRRLSEGVGAEALAPSTPRPRRGRVQPVRRQPLPERLGLVLLLFLLPH